MSEPQPSENQETQPQPEQNKNPANRPPDPQGGRVHGFTTKINIYEAEALNADRQEMEKKLGRKLKPGTYMRLRLLNGGEKLNVNYPPPVVDTRRAKRGTRPKRTPKPKTPKPEQNNRAA